MNTTQSTYTKFQEWLNDCPVDILEYEDHVDTVNVRFELPLEEEKVWTMSPRLEVARVLVLWQITITQIHFMRRLYMMIITLNGVVFHRIYTIVVEKVYLTVEKG